MTQNQSETEFAEIMDSARSQRAAIATGARAAENAATGGGENANGDPEGKKQLTPRARGDKMQQNVGSALPTYSLRCDKHKMPFATVDRARGLLIIVSRHRGDWCENHIPLSELGLMATPESKPKGRTGARPTPQALGEPVPTE